MTLRSSSIPQRWMVTYMGCIARGGTTACAKTKACTRGHARIRGKQTKGYRTFRVTGELWKERQHDQGNDAMPPPLSDNDTT
jgi:hypothetical protein